MNMKGKSDGIYEDGDCYMGFTEPMLPPEHSGIEDRAGLTDEIVAILRGPDGQIKQIVGGC